jgi:hypothetical protein
MGKAIIKQAGNPAPTTTDSSGSGTSTTGSSTGNETGSTTPPAETEQNGNNGQVVSE